MTVFSPTDRQVHRMIEAAIQAPSADNDHHVLFAIRDDGLDLRTDEFFSACPSGHRRHLTLLSYGAIVENLRLTLVDLGWSFETVWFPARDDSSLLLRIEWAAMERVPNRDPLVDHIDARHTNRGLFRGPKLSTHERAAIEAACGPSAGVTLEWFDSKRPRRALLRLMRLAETARFKTRKHHRELFDSIAFDAGWHRSATRLIAPGSLAIEPPLRMAFKALRHWPLMRFLQLLGVHHAVGFRAGDLPGRLAPHLLAITSDSVSDSALLEGARLLQRIWLTTQSLGLALQPMVASAVLISDRDEAFPEQPSRLGQQLAAGWSLLLKGNRPLVVMRLGRAAPVRIRSQRRAVDEYVIRDDRSDKK